MVEHITLVNTVTGDSLDMNMADTRPYVLESVDWGTLVAKANTCRYLGQIGSTPIDIIVQERDVAIVAWIVPGDGAGMDDCKDWLNAFVNPTQKMQLLYGDKILEFYSSVSVQYGTDEATNNEVMAKFQISGTAYDPLFRDDAESAYQGTLVTPMLHFPLVIPEGGIQVSDRERSVIFDVVNGGSISVGARIVFSAIGAVTNPYLLNLNTQEQIKINKSMVAGESVEVSTVIGSKTVTGTLNGAQSNYFKYLDIDSSWIQLTPGDNIFRFGASSGESNLDVSVFYTTRYMEVQECY